MYYDLIIVKPKINKKKIAILFIIIALLIITVSILLGIKFAEIREEQIIAEKNAKIEQLRIEEERRLEEKRQEELRIAEEKRQEELKLAEERKRKSRDPFTEEQLLAIENIYDSEEKRVFLTFDDGPTTTVTPLILDLLKQENIKATFFVLGNSVEANPDLIKREYEEGHYIANHGYSHVYKEIYADPQNVLDEYNYTNDAIHEALGTTEYNTRVFRFPGGSVGGYYRDIKTDAKQLLRDNKIASLDWNALTKDAEGAHTKESILKNLEETVEDKQSVVVLMHDAYDKILTYECLPDVIQFFRDRGYTFKNIYDIL